MDKMTDQPALTSAERLTLPALLPVREVAELLGYRDVRSAARWLRANGIRPRANCGHRKWPRAAIVDALNGSNSTAAWRARA